MDKPRKFMLNMSIILTEDMLEAMQTVTPDQVFLNLLNNGKPEDVLDIRNLDDVSPELKVQFALLQMWMQVAEDAGAKEVGTPEQVAGMGLPADLAKLLPNTVAPVERPHPASRSFGETFARALGAVMRMEHLPLHLRIAVLEAMRTALIERMTKPELPSEYGQPHEWTPYVEQLDSKLAELREQAGIATGNPMEGYS